MAFDGTEILASPSGAALRLRTAVPSDPRAVVHICHGLAEHSARYGRFAGALKAAGFAVYAHDHRGHGETTAPDAPLGRFANSDGIGALMADIEAVHARIARDHPGLPLVLFGHSMGAIVALNSALRRSGHLAGAALWNGNVSPGVMGRLGQAILAWERFRLGSDLPSQILPHLTFQAWNRTIAGARTDFDWLSRDEAEVRRYIDDPLCGWPASVAMWSDIFAMVFHAAEDGHFATMRKSLPISLVGGGADPSTRGGVAVRELGERLRRMGFSNLRTRIWPANRHESLNELNRDEITADFLSWIETVIGNRATPMP